MTDTPTAAAERIRIKQERGPSIDFTGSLVAKTEYTTRRGDEMRLELWQTIGGAYIALSETNRETRATVIEPGDEFEMRCAVMDAWDWDVRAKSMVRDVLKWKMIRQVA